MKGETMSVITEQERCPNCTAVTLRTILGPEGESGPYDVCCDACGYDMYVPAETKARTRIEAVRAIVRDHQATRIDGYIVDVMTASMLVAVYDGLKPDNKEKFGRVPLLKLVELGWSAVKAK
jgi:hypothetical protein